MPSRTQSMTLVFERPFVLKGPAGAQPAGTYTVETEEELLEGLSFPAYRRVTTTMTRVVQPGSCIQVLTVDPRDLAQAHAADHD